MIYHFHMLLNRVAFLTGLDGLVVPPGSAPGTAAPPPVNGALPPAPAAAAQGGAPGIDWWMMLIWIGVLVAVFFFMTRTQRKKEKQVKDMQSGIRSGDNVVTSGGMFGKVVEVGEDCFIVEFGTNRSIRIPVQKADIMGVKDPIMTPPPTPES